MKKTSSSKWTRDPFRTVADIATTLCFSKESILRFQHEVTSNPARFLEPLPSSTPTGSIHLSTSITAPRLETQRATIDKITEKIEELSLGEISKSDIQKAIEQKCISRALSILYSAVYQWKDSQDRLEIFAKAGDEFLKEDGSKGTRAGGICYAFLRQNGLLKKITHKEMATELKTLFEETTQTIKTNLADSNVKIDDNQLRRILASELCRKSGGRSKEPYNIQTAKEAAETFCQRIVPEKEEYPTLAKNLTMTAATFGFVESTIPEKILNHLLENPLKPVYERRPSGEILLDPSSGKPALNPAIPEKWRKEEVKTKVENTFEALRTKISPENLEILGGLLDTLRLPRRINIPLQVALDSLTQKLPTLPSLIKKASEAQKDLLAYEITKPAHSLAYKLGITMAAASEGLLSKSQSEELERIQTAVESFPENPQAPKTYKEILFPEAEDINSALAQVENLFQTAKQTLSKQKTGHPTMEELPLQTQ